MKRTANKPLKQGRYWWQEHASEPAKLVFVQKECLGMFVLGTGWANFQHGDWIGPTGENQDQQDADFESHAE